MTKDWKRFLRDYTDVTPSAFYGLPDDQKLYIHANYLEWRKSKPIPDISWRWFVAGWALLVICAVMASSK